MLAIWAAFEMTVVDETADLFARAFGWYRLFRHWASLRWNDTHALIPHFLQSRHEE